MFQAFSYKRNVRWSLFNVELPVVIRMQFVRVYVCIHVNGLEILSRLARTKYIIAVFFYFFIIIFSLCYSTALTWLLLLECWLWSS